MGRRFKRKILDEFCQVCGDSLCNWAVEPNVSPAAHKRPGPRQHYDAQDKAEEQPDAGQKCYRHEGQPLPVVKGLDQNGIGGESREQALGQRPASRLRRLSEAENDAAARRVSTPPSRRRERRRNPEQRRRSLTQRMAEKPANRNKKQAGTLVPACVEQNNLPRGCPLRRASGGAARGPRGQRRGA